MLYREIKPPPILSDYVQLIWIQEADLNGHDVPPARIVTDGIVELVFHFGQPFLTYYADHTTEKQATSFVIAQLHRHLLIQPQGKIGIIAVRFQPWGAYHFFNRPIREFPGITLPLKYLWQSRAAEIEEKICTARDNDTRINIMIRFLTEQLTRYHKHNYAADKLIQLIHTSRGQHALQVLRDKTGIGERALERHFKSTIGVSPKHFSRITRFLHTCRFIRLHKDKSLTQVTYECGYYDQAHLIREFKEFAGITPKEFFASANTSFTLLE